MQALAPGATAALEPGVADYVMEGGAPTPRAARKKRVSPACLLAPDRIRPALARLLRKAAPRLRVLGHSEVPETLSIRIGRIIGEAK